MKSYLTALFIIIPFILFAQSNYHPGFVVKNNGDTVKGYIDYREWDRTPKSIHFKTNENGNETLEFDPQTIKTFEITGLEHYISYSGLISMDKTSFPDLPAGPDTSKMLQTIFLRQVTTGKHVTLYQQKDDIKNRFFIAESASPIIELNYYQYYSDDNVVTESTGFKGQLGYYINQFDANDKSLISFTERASFTESNLRKIVDNVNGNNAPVNQKMEPKGSRFFGGIGANYTQTEFFLVNYAVSSYTTSPRLNAGFDIFVNPNVQQLILRAELSIYYVNPKFNLPDGSVYTFRQYTAAFTPQILFNVYNKDAFKIYIDGGVSFNFSAYANDKITYTASNTVQNSPYQLEPYWANFPLQAGVIINKKLDFAFTYMGFAAYTKYTGLSVSNRTMGVGFKYLLGK
ncbi:MAG TPA: hypothetical protein VIM89_12550 [Mucilaginibacter sp.]